MPSPGNKKGRGADSTSRQRLSPIARELNPDDYRPGESERHPRSIAGDPFTSAEPIRQYEKGRICATPGCKNKLSIYNPSAFCSQHPATKLLSIGDSLPKSVRTKTQKPPKRRRISSGRA